MPLGRKSIQQVNNAIGLHTVGESLLREEGGARLLGKLIRIKVLVVPSKRYETQFAQNVTRRQWGVHRSQFNLGYWYQGHLNNSGHSGKP